MSWITWPLRLIGFAAWFAYAVVVSNLAVLTDLLTPSQRSTPGIVALATRCETNAEITLLSSLITLTPGTLSLGLHTPGPHGQRVLYVHGMYAADADTLREELAGMETRMLRAVRREGFGR